MTRDGTRHTRLPTHRPPRPRGRTRPMVGMRSYASVAASPGFAPWAAVAVLARLPLAMMPLGLVLIGVERGSLSLGAALAGLFTAGEVVAAPVLARRLPVVGGLVAMGLAAVAMAAVSTAGATAPVLAATAAVLGVCGAGVPGQVRVWLTDLAPADLRSAAYSLETTASAALYVAGPAVVALLSVATPATAMATAGVLLLFGGFLAASRGRRQAAGREGMPWPRVLGRIWPACVGAGCFMGAVAALDVAVPALLLEGGRTPEAAGYLLGAFAASGILGGAVYGTRSWPGRPAARAAVTSLVMTGVLMLVTVAGSNGAMLAVLLVAGLFGPPSLIARSLGVQEDLAGADLAVGFSLLSAAAGAGAAATSFALGGLLALVAVQPALVTVLAALAILTVTVTAVELARAP